MDIIFAIDIVFMFSMSFYDDNMKLVDERKIIALNYIRGSFILDVVAIIPFELLLDNDPNQNINGLVRITKIGRLQKLIKLTRLLKMLKIMKSKANILRLT